MNKAARQAVAEAAAWCQEPFVVFDTETTGFGSDDQIIQIAIVDQYDNTLLNSYIKPDGPILNSEYHGITDEIVQDAPDFPTIYPLIVGAMAGKRVVAYNLDYDRRMLNQVIARHKLDRLQWTGATGMLCAMELYAQFHGDWNSYRRSYRWQKLDVAVKALGISRNGYAHDALSDAQATLAVLWAMANQA